MFTYKQIFKILKFPGFITIVHGRSFGIWYTGRTLFSPCIASPRITKFARSMFQIVYVYVRRIFAVVYGLLYVDQILCLSLTFSKINPYAHLNKDHWPKRSIATISATIIERKTQKIRKKKSKITVRQKLMSDVVGTHCSSLSYILYMCVCVTFFFVYTVHFM